MLRIGPRPLFPFMVLFFFPWSAAATEDFCLTPGTASFDSGATQSFQQLEHQADPGLMQRLVGTWASTTSASGTNQISYLYETFEPGGLYRYLNKVCGGQVATCSQYEGVGVYAVRAQAGDGFLGGKVVSDLTLNHACLGLSGRFLGASAFVSPSGVVSRRIR